MPIELTATGDGVAPTTIDGERLWASLMTLAEIGALPNGGVCRLAGSDEDRRARDLFAGWCAEAGLSLRVDAIGNMFARREGRDPARPPVITGSHLDTQPIGGKFDGAFGVLAALEVVRSLNDAGHVTDAPIEIVNWTNEEGCRFQPSSLGAEVAAGHISLRDALLVRDADGSTLGDALAAIGYAGPDAPDVRGAAAYLEAHIEQGPVLEAEAIPIGVVDGSMGINAFQIVLTGREAHTGTTPILSRRDALLGAARCISDIQALGLQAEPRGRATVASITVEPNARSVVASRAAFTADCRHESQAGLDRMTAALRSAVDSAAAACGLGAEMRCYWAVPPRRFDPACIAAVERAASRLGLRHRRLVSGAGHDAIPVAAIVPTAMIFVPSRGGISHNQEEYTAPAEIASGCEVLLGALLTLAG